MIGDVRAGKGTFGKLATDDTLYNKLRDTSTNLATASAKLNDNTTTAGKIFFSPQLYDNFAGLYRGIRRLIVGFLPHTQKILPHIATIFFLTHPFLLPHRLCRF